LPNIWYGNVVLWQQALQIHDFLAGQTVNVNHRPTSGKKNLSCSNTVSFILLKANNAFGFSKTSA